MSTRVIILALTIFLPIFMGKHIGLRRSACS